MSRPNESFTFSQVPRADIPRSAFNRSHGYKTTFDAGYLVPIYVDEALPGDTFSVKLSAFARLATPLFPVMDNMWMDFFFFAVPNRLVWSTWQRFMGEQPTPGASTDFEVPEVDFGTGSAAIGSLFDYMGIPTGITGLKVNALPFRAYNLIWDEWFRDENLQSPVVATNGEGPDAPGAYTLLRRGKRHDYFTSCLPWPQKGPGVELPIGGTAPVIPRAGFPGPGFKNYDDAASPSHGLYEAGTDALPNVQWGAPAGMLAGQLVWGDPGLVADLSQATAATINELRLAFQWQKLQERDARGGTRYTEILRAHFGVVSPDARLQRPEFLGGGSVPIVVNPVTQTSQSGTEPDQTNVKGSLAAYGVAGARGIGFTKSFVEHSYVIGLVHVRADLSYQQGLPKLWTRKSKLDFYWPALSHIGEQSVLYKEIYCQNNEYDDQVFGYQERWAEYRYFPSQITGKFRSTAAQSLDAWHLAQEFGALPTLSDTFIEDRSDDPIRRAIAVQSEPQFLFDSHFDIRCVRPMPAYSVPGLIDHF